MRKFSSILFVSSCFLTMQGCIKHQSGYVFDNQKLAMVKTDISTKFDVISILGTPTFASLPNNKNFYYAEQKSYRFLFIRDIPYDRKILELSFNDNDVLAKMRFYNLDSAKKGCMN